jgi:hypothetical protein
MLEPMKINPAINTPTKISMPTLLGFFDSFSCTECLAGGAIGGGAVAVLVPAGTDVAVAIRLLSLRKFGQLGTPGQEKDGWVIRENCYNGMNMRETLCRLRERPGDKPCMMVKLV